ncbi:MAG: DUF3880 domain-containing protein [Lachnospiraceae bacterium]|nr:DUF3880 domain-containing protein [Lachnospiraceae bacterium]
MKVLLIDWNSYGNEYMKSLMTQRGYKVVLRAFDDKKTGKEMEDQKRELSEALGTADKPDYVFSYNYFPEVSNVCQEKNVKYISWIYDSPYLNIYSYTAINPVNCIFVFDYGVYREFETGGIKTVHYLPLGVYEPALNKYQITNGNEAEDGYALADNVNYKSDISFVGSLYSESKHRLYEKFKSISPYAKGYLDAIIKAQKNIYGENILESLITPDIENELQKAYPTDPNATTVMSPVKLYSQFVLSRQVTAQERSDILTFLGKYGSDNNLSLDLFTPDKNTDIPGWQNKGIVDYYNGMSEVFNTSKINLNITLRSILTGIPLRAFDIMGAGGFLISNYQAEYEEYFSLGEDMVIYENYDDLMARVDYFLTHEKDRAEIAYNGQKKVFENHSLSARLDVMESYL